MSVSLSRILIATDFSASSNRALKYADVLADMFRAELHVLHIVVEPLPMLPPNCSVPRLVDQAKQDLVTNILNAELKYGSEPIKAIEVGDPFEQILQYAQDKKIDLIVMGTQGHRGLSRLLLGSVADKVVRMAKCPVLTVHADQ